MEIHFAPVQGHTDNTYRGIHAEMYPGINLYYTPFIRLEHGELRKKDKKDAEVQTAYPLRPQVIFRNAEELLPLMEILYDAGNRSVDLNMGCPFPLQTAKGRGCALAGSEEAARLVKEVTEKYPDVEFSVKMRLGMTAPDEWRKTLPILNEARLSQVTLHPRMASQQYGGVPDMEQFDAFYSECAHPVIYNGDICTPQDAADIMERYPRLKGIMIGRGLLGRPSLASEIVNGELEKGERIRKMLTFHRRLLESYRSNLIGGDHQVLDKIKPFWEYAEAEIGRKAWKSIKKAQNMAKYLSAVAMVQTAED